ncbi:hypothetical protein Tco_1184542 [Tanacetum coccineum]
MFITITTNHHSLHQRRRSTTDSPPDRTTTTPPQLSLHHLQPSSIVVHLLNTAKHRGIDDIRSIEVEFDEEDQVLHSRN